MLATSTAGAATLPAGYTRLAYIESTGTQYIDTGLTPTPNFRAVVDFQFPAPTGGGGFGKATTPSPARSSPSA